MKKGICLMIAVLLLFVFTACSADNSAKAVTGIQIDENGHLLYTLSDGSSIEVGNVKGEDGKDGIEGVGIKTAYIDESGDLIIECTDGNIINAGYVVSKDGADGKDGLNGKDGVDGKDGLNGKDGVDGKDGLNGKDGVDGKDGLNGKDGADGKDGLNGKDGADGKDGVTPHIGENGNWYIGDEDTGIYAGSDVEYLLEYEDIDGDKVEETILCGYVGERAHVVVPDGVNVIDEYAFADNNTILSVTLPDSVFEIKDYAFSNCRQLESVDMPEKISRIGFSAFADCRSLKSIELPPMYIRAYLYLSEEGIVDGMDPYAAGGDAWLLSGAFSGCKSLESVSFKSGVYKDVIEGGEKFIPPRQVEYNSTINYDDGFFIMTESLFGGCEALKHLELPEGLTVIEEGGGMISQSGVEELVLPSTVNEIGSYALQNEKLRELTIFAVKPPKASEKQFVWDDNLGMEVEVEVPKPIFGDYPPPQVIYVPAESVDAYKQSLSWSSYADIIKPIE